MDDGKGLLCPNLCGLEARMIEADFHAADAAGSRHPGGDLDSVGARRAEGFLIYSNAFRLIGAKQKPKKGKP